MNFKNLFLTICFFIVYVGFSSSPDLQLDTLLKDRLISKEHARLFSKILTQDNEGRIKPFHTVSSEILRKISRKESIYSQTATQVVLGMMIDPLLWQMIPVIKVSNPDILKVLDQEGPLVSFVSFFNKNNNYVLTSYVENAYSKKPIDRSKFDKRK